MKVRIALALFFLVQIVAAQNVIFNKVEVTVPNTDEFLRLIDKENPEAKFLAELEVQGYSMDHVETFKKIIESKVQSNLKLGEIAFLCNMSLSTFKRHFTSEYKTTPGKWLQERRLETAKKLLEKGELKSSDIYLDFVYNNLSNFSIAFKNKYGFSPKNLKNQ